MFSKVAREHDTAGGRKGTGSNHAGNEEYLQLKNYYSGANNNPHHAEVNLRYSMPSL